MDVGRAVDDALVEDHVHELHDGVVVGGALEGGDVVRIALERVVGVETLAEALEHVGHRVARIAVVLRNALGDVLLARHDEAHFLREGERDLVGDAGINQIRCREGHGRIVRANAQDVVHARDRGGDGVYGVVVQLHLREVHHLASLVCGHHAEQGVLVDVAAVHQDLTRGLAGVVRHFLAHARDALFVEDAVLLQEVEKRIELLGHYCCLISSLSFATTVSGSCDLVMSSS